MASGKVMIFMGDGYGKSAAAFGIAMKRASENDRVVIIQFLKGKGITESEFTKRLEPEIKIFRFEKSKIDYRDRSPEEQEEAAANIRNSASLSGNTDALYVVDGVIVESLFGINVYAVDHVEILKDANIYGAMGGNGAIVVYTRRGTDKKAQ